METGTEGRRDQLRDPPVDERCIGRWVLSPMLVARCSARLGSWANPPFGVTRPVTRPGVGITSPRRASVFGRLLLMRRRPVGRGPAHERWGRPEAAPPLRSRLSHRVVTAKSASASASANSVSARVADPPGARACAGPGDRPRDPVACDPIGQRRPGLARATSQTPNPPPHSGQEAIETS